MSERPAHDVRLDRLQLLTVVIPVVYIIGIAMFLRAVDLPLLADIGIAAGVSLPLVAIFAYTVFGVISRAQRELVKEEARFRDLVESAPDAIVIVDTAGHIKMVNDQVRLMFGYEREELLGQSVDHLLPENLHGLHARRRAEFSLSAGTRPMGGGLDLVGRRKDGTEFPCEISLSLLKSDGDMLVTSVIRDVSERRRAEIERERLLAETEAEAERQRIGMDLHDGVIQSIYAVGLNLEAAADDVHERPDEVRRRIDKAIDELNDTIGDIRSYIFELRPTRFTGDLQASLTNLLQEFRVNSLIEVTLGLSPEPPPLDEERSLAVFHIAQEALNNVKRHARASSVQVNLTGTPGTLRLEVRDNGAGFEPQINRSEEHRGLRNIAARAEHAGGTLCISSAPGGGTTLQVDIPVKAGTGERR